MSFLRELKEDVMRRMGITDKQLKEDINSFKIESLIVGLFNIAGSFLGICFLLWVLWYLVVGQDFFR
jgi:hypothetical protein